MNSTNILLLTIRKEHTQLFTKQVSAASGHRESLTSLALIVLLLIQPMFLPLVKKKLLKLILTILANLHVNLKMVLLKLSMFLISITNSCVALCVFVSAWFRIKPELRTELKCSSIITVSLSLKNTLPTHAGPVTLSIGLSLLSSTQLPVSLLLIIFFCS